MAKKYVSKRTGSVFVELWSNAEGKLLQGDSSTFNIPSWWTNKDVEQALTELAAPLYSVMAGDLGLYTRDGKPLLWPTYTEAAAFAVQRKREFPHIDYYVVKLVKVDKPE